MNILIRIAPAILLLLILPLQAHAENRIVVLKVSGAINPVVAEYLSEEIRQANADREALVVIEMDTPGGLDTSMRQIIKEIQNSDVAVATYVYPGGSRAASAGIFIAFASHIAAMAPGTNMGAAHPVNMLAGGEGKDAGKNVMEEKVTNDAAAYIRSLAEQRGRNAHWAELAVRKSVSISAEEALKLDVIDLIATNLDALLLAIDGREIRIDSKTIHLSTKNREVVVRTMSQRQRILNIISDPNVAYILLMLGLVGLYFELSNPGLILPGVIGGICLILAMYAMHTLPINYAGLMLIVLGVILLIAEVNVVSFGLLSAGAVISLLLGSLMLMQSDDPAMQISITVLVPTMVFFILVSAGVLYLAIQSARRKAVSGVEAIIGSTAVVKTDLDPEGSVLMHGETWNAECDVGPVPAGERVVVESVNGLNVKVKPAGKELP